MTDITVLSCLESTTGERPHSIAVAGVASPLVIPVWEGLEIPTMFRRGHPACVVGATA